MSAASLSGRLEAQHGFWAHWGFEPWASPPLAGVSRLQRFVKGGMLGRVAEYRAWDCIVWTPGSEEDRARLWSACRPLPDVLTQRFLFLLDDPWPERRIRSFAWGFRGYAEFFACLPGTGAQANEKIRDLAGLVELALKLPEAGSDSGAQAIANR